jgi:hypothetical protein
MEILQLLSWSISALLMACLLIILFKPRWFRP